MCTQIHPQVPKTDKLPLGARVFIEGKDRPLHITESREEATLRVNAARRDNALADVTNLNGEGTSLPPERIVSIVAPTPRDKQPIQIADSPFWGFGVKVRGVSPSEDYDVLPQSVIDIMGTQVDECAVVEPGDMASDIAAIVHVPTGNVVYANPAEPERCIRRYVKVVRLLAESKALFDEAHAPAVPE